MPDRPYIFFELTNSLCNVCLRTIEAKVVFELEPEADKLFLESIEEMDPAMLKKARVDDWGEARAPARARYR